MLYVKNTTTRNVIDLNGLWNFKLDEVGYANVNTNSSLDTDLKAYVPGSFNEQFASDKIRKHTGNVFYEREFVIPKILEDERKVLRFGSATHHAKVYINGNFAIEHKGGFTPFEVDITEFVNVGKNRIFVILSNVLDYSTLPVGVYSQKEEDGKLIETVSENFDFFNYAGLNRPVKIYTTSKTYIDDITITYDVDLKNLSANLNIKTDIVGDNYKVEVVIIDEDNKEIASGEGEICNLEIKNVNLWKPLNSYLYKANVKVYKGDLLLDEYEEDFGIRTVEVKNNKFLINGEEFYFKGFGKHEDSHLHGRGLDELLNVTDISLIKWINANSIRTSHYPYSEEMMRLCDREGIVVIDEFTAVGLFHGFGFNLLGDKNKKSTWNVMQTHDAHKQVIKETIKRDKNHACVVMFCVANEPDSSGEGAYEYFKPMFDLTRELDPQKRPVCYVNIMLSTPETDKVMKLSDVICLNRYMGWYVDLANFELAELKQKEEIEKWHTLYPDKPILFTEYGADTLAGLHSVYNIPFTEDFQISFYDMYSKCFDAYDYIIGEQLWNFADFQTKFDIFRVDGNKKGIFTRERNPKSIARYLKDRWKKI